MDHPAIAFLCARTGFDAPTVERGVHALRLYAAAAGALTPEESGLEPAEVARARRVYPVYVAELRPGETTPNGRPALCMMGEVTYLRRVAGFTLECALSFVVAEAYRAGAAQGRYAEVEAGELAVMLGEQAN